MLLHSLEVRDFRAIRQASLTFGRGLNVLFGPNDLGKSSLLDALRAAFLLPCTSKDGEEFLPWSNSEKFPTVVVGFQTTNGIWRITKEFAFERKGKAILERLGENDCVLDKITGKAVEEKIRKEAALGIPPGQKKGLAESYLTAALLGHQENVTEVLKEDLGPNGPGYDLVTKAMGALAQDPLLKRLLEELAERTDEAFTSKGQSKKNGPLDKRTKEIEKQKQSVNESEQRVRESRGIEDKVTFLTKETKLLADECSSLQRRRELLQQVNLAEEDLNRVQAIEDARLALEASGYDLKSKDQNLADATSARRRIQEALKAARDTFSKSSGAYDEIRKTAQHRREARQAEILAERQSAGSCAELANAVIQAKKQIKILGESLGLAEKERVNRACRVETAEEDLNQAKAAIREAQDNLAEAQRQANRREFLQLSLAPAKGAAREAERTVSAVKDFAGLSRQLERGERSLTELIEKDQSLENRLKENAAEKEAREAKGPTPVPLHVMETLIAFFIGGASGTAIGLALGLGSLSLALAICGGAALAGALTAFFFWYRESLHSDRAWRRQLDLLDKQRAVLLEERNQVTLNKGIAHNSVDSFQTRRDQLNVTIGKVTLEEAERHHQEAINEVERIENELATPGNSTQVEGAKQAVSERVKEGALRDQCLVEARNNLKESETKLGILEAQFADAKSKSAMLAAKLGETTAEQALLDAEKEQKQAEQALKVLAEAPNLEVETAEKEMKNAQVEVTRLEQNELEATAQLELATKGREDTRQACENARVKYEAILQSASKFDRPSAEAALGRARNELEQDQSGTDLPQTLEKAKTLLEERTRAFRKTECALQEARGALKHVGGLVAREQFAQEREVLAQLEETGRELELEYRATKYLLDVLREEEAKQTAHLGRCLAEPVTRLFRDLTNSDRYSQIVFQPQLRVQHVIAGGGEREWEVLSVGTRDQLATIIRLALAALLKTVVVFDDQLTQSDCHRVAWFRDQLRQSVREHGHQIIVITCRPLDYVRQDELPQPPADRFEGDEGRLVVMDLEKLVS